MLFSVSLFGQSQDLLINGQTWTTNKPVTNLAVTDISGRADSIAIYRLDSGYTFIDRVLTLYNAFNNKRTKDDVESCPKDSIIASKNALTVVVPDDQSITLDSCIWSNGLLTISNAGSLTIDSDTLTVTGNGVVLNNSGSLTIKSSDTTAITSGAWSNTFLAAEAKITNKNGKVEILGNGQVSLSSGGDADEDEDDPNPAWSIEGGAVTTNSFAKVKPAGTTDSITINSSTGTVDLSLGTVEFLGKVAAAGDILLGGNVTTGYNGGASFITTNGAITYGVKTKRSISMLDATKDISFNQAVSHADTIRSSTGKVEVNAAIDTVDVLYAKTTLTTSGVYVKADSIGAGGAITLNGTTAADIIVSGSGAININGKTDVNSPDDEKHGGILSGGAVNINGATVSVNVADTVGIVGKAVNIRAGSRVSSKGFKITIDGTEYDSGITASESLLVEDGASVGSGGAVRATGTASIDWRGAADSVNFIGAVGSGTVDIVSTARIRRKNAGGGPDIISNTGAITISAENETFARTIRSKSGAITISGVTTAADSIATTNTLTITKSVSVNSTSATAAIRGGTVDITGGTITALTTADEEEESDIEAVYGISSPGKITISPSAVLSKADSIISTGSDVEITTSIGSTAELKGVAAPAGKVSISSTGGGKINTLSGTKVIVESGANIQTDTVILGEGELLTVAGKLKHNGNIELEGALEVPTGGTLELGADSLVIATHITIAGTVSGVAADSIAATEGDLVISGTSTLRAGSLTSENGEIRVTESANVVITSQKETPLSEDNDGPAYIEAARGLFITGGSVTVPGEDEILDIAESTDVSVTKYGTLKRADNSAVKIGTTDTKGLYDVDGSATVIVRPGYPRIKSHDVTYADDYLTVTLTVDSVENNPKATNPQLWYNYTSVQNGYTYDPSEVEGEETELLNQVLTKKTLAAALDYAGIVSVTTSKGVARVTVNNPKPSTDTDRNRDGNNVGQAASADWAEKEKWPSHVDTDGTNETSVYSNEKLIVKFKFAKTATKNETLEYGPKGTSENPDIMSYLNASTDVLSAGENEVTVEFTFKKEVNLALRSAILTRAGLGPKSLTASVKGTESGLFGTASSDPVTLYDAPVSEYSFTAGTIGYEGTADLGLKGGNGAEQYRVKDASGDVVIDWDYVSDFKADLTPARLAKIFEVGAYIEIKSPNTGDNITITILGPNTSAGGSNPVSPDANHRIHLEYDAQLQTPSGLYPSVNQSFTFNVARPLDVEANDLVVTIVGLNDTGEEIPSAAIVTLVENLSKDGWKVLITDITTEVRIRISFRVGVSNAVVSSTSVWGASGSLTISSPVRGIASIYTILGSRVSEFTYSEGTTSISLPIGTYVIVLSDGTRSKVIIR
jgi:hypothetical protein